MYDCYRSENSILEIKYFKENLSLLDRIYRNKFIAVHENRVIDFDEDESELVSRINSIIDSLAPVVIFNPSRHLKFLMTRFSFFQFLNPN